MYVASIAPNLIGGGFGLGSFGFGKGGSCGLHPGGAPGGCGGFRAADAHGGGAPRTFSAEGGAFSAATACAAASSSVRHHFFNRSLAGPHSGDPSSNILPSNLKFLGGF